jgi:hypothetical protein
VLHTYAIDALPAVLNTEKAAQPYKNAKPLPYIFWKKIYCPPVSGNMAAASALVNAPNKTTTPATTQTINNKTGDPSCDAITEGFIKIPEPITPPTTMAITEDRESVRCSCDIGLKIKAILIAFIFIMSQVQTLRLLLREYLLYQIQEWDCLFAELK